MLYFISKAIARTFDTKGRTSRPAFWWVFLCFVFATMALVALDYLLFEHVLDAPVEVYFPLTDTFYFISLLTMTTLTMRRWHDVGILSWPVIVIVAVDVVTMISTYGKPEVTLINNPLFLVAAIAGLASLVVCILPSEAQKNRYGPNPSEVLQ